MNAPGPPGDGWTSSAAAISAAKPRNPTSAADGNGASPPRRVCQHQYASPVAHVAHAAAISAQAARTPPVTARARQAAPAPPAAAAMPWATSETAVAAAVGNRTRQSRQAAATAGGPAVHAPGGP